MVVAVAPIPETSKQAKYSRRKSNEVAEIGPLPAVVHPARKELCRYDLLLYAQSYFPESTGLSPFSPSHVRAIERIERAILVGGYFAEIVFRGWAKSTITEVATMWGVSYGHIRFPVPIGGDAKLAKSMLDSIKSEFESNDLLLDDFPEICFPVRCLEGKPQRCGSQTFDGELTNIEWTAEYIVLPTIPGSKASGAVIKPRGITASLRGMRHKRPDGTQARPDFVILDDPQTDESARSPDQVQNRLKILNKTILRLGGHNRRLAVVCNATIIEPDDMIARLADAKKFPAWQSEKIPMLESFAEQKAHDELWLGEYARLRNTYDNDSPGDQERAHREATEFYVANRESMDIGAKPSWIHCYEKGVEVSAIQHAYNILIDTGLEAFMAECQNEPIQQQDDIDLLPAAKIAEKITGYDRRIVPDECSTVTAFTDVQGEHLFYMVCAWEPDFTGYVIDYGAWPDQRRNYFTRRDIRVKLSGTYAGDESGMTFAALQDLETRLAGDPYRTPSGRVLQLSRWCIDGNWRSRTKAVESFARQSPHKGIITITQGRGVKASERPFSEALRSIKWRTGPAWFWQDDPGPARWVTFDANLWKKRVHEGLSLGIGSRGSIQLFNARPHEHQMIADHLRAEKPVKVQANGRTVYEWQEKPGQDNEGLDCLVGCALAASIEKIHRDAERPVSKKKKLSLAEYQNRARGK